ncbi:MAG: hypothetical protein F4239_07775 [Gammaproteobacteria bacterium]|nr:hypothetical protein [Gammaproteobacteria bacterium]
MGIKADNVSIDDVGEFQGLILKWAEQNGRTFPWRRTGESKYRLAVTELLLQRTKAETVANYYAAFFSQFPNWKILAETSEKAIGETLKPLGLWRRRAPILQKLATVMVARNGRFPRERKELNNLPGVGQYIGNAIELLCHNKPRPLLDEGMARVLERYFGPRKLADIRNDPYLQKLSHLVISHESPRELNWAMLDLAAIVCKIREPSCTECSLNIKCRLGRQIINSKNLQ